MKISTAQEAINGNSNDTVITPLRLKQVLNSKNIGGGGSGGITKETDPIFKASPAAKITDADIKNWNSGTGGGGGVVEETDPTVPQFVKEITQEDIDRWNSGTGGGEHSDCLDTVPIGSRFLYDGDGVPDGFEEVDGVVTVDNVVSRNLFNKNTAKSDYRLASDGVPYTEKGYSLSDYIKVKPNTAYIRSKTGEFLDTMESVSFYDANKNFIVRYTNGTYRTTTNETQYVRLSVQTKDIDTLQFEEGSTATDYVPYLNLEEVMNKKEDYTEDEVVIGTWFGKPLYRRLVNCGNLTNASSKSVAHNIANINYIVGIKGFAYVSSGTTLPLPYVDSTLNSLIGVLANRTNITIWNLADRSSWNAFVILKYTKTTD